ncbi:Bowman-Birk type proteinase inhibitor-like [Gastrolobium bilobum]|uniref:Bowman-Birk type proteinase inhibitor-like n=1 Tax=Gastrolobium bilobum TaxID=150636 RepID=UPI002AB14772|nr:Bowman-Birk type proteinase inhibitor-like [Gastrolobium bilobum]
MELNNKVLVKVALFVFLLGVTATVDAHFDPASFINEVLPNNGDGSYYVKSTTKACCDNCSCTKSIPPICRCTDIGETCHSACKFCICTRSFPPQCRCTDTTNFCYDPCNSSEAEAEAH